MGTSEYHYKKTGSDKNIRRKIGEHDRAIIAFDDVKKKQKKVLQKGPRALFLEKYKVTGDVTKARKELEQDGISLDCLEDDVLKTWIDSER